MTILITSARNNDASGGRCRKLTNGVRASISTHRGVSEIGCADHLMYISQPELQFIDKAVQFILLQYGLVCTQNLFAHIVQQVNSFFITR